MVVKTKTIYVDLDDVLCETARHFLAIIEREFGKRVSYEELTDFDVGASCGLLAEEREELYRIVHEPDELMQMVPVAEGLSTLEQWAKAGYEIAIVTGRPPQSYEASLAWLTRHDVAHHSFTMVDKYARFGVQNTIAISLAELACRDFYWAVEDSLPMAQYLAHQMSVPVALIDRPWNQADGMDAQVNRFPDWPSITRGMPTVAGREVNNCGLISSLRRGGS